MRAIIDPAAGAGVGSKAYGMTRRLLWFVALWAAGVASVAAVSLLLRAWIGS